MAKVPHPKPKPTSKALPPRSRLSRRAASPPLPTHTPDHRPAPTSTHTTLSGSISKKRPRVKPLSRTQRLRKEKGIERAETVIERMGRKVELRVGREGVRRGRRRGWGDVNLGLKGGMEGKGGGEGGGEGGEKEKKGEEGRKGEEDKSKEGKGEEDGDQGEEKDGKEWVDEESEDGDEIDKRIREARVVVDKRDGVGVGLEDGGGVGEKEEEEL